MSYNHVYPRCCLYSSSDPDQSKDIGQFKLYQFFVFCIPILFTFALLFVFYLFYLRPRRRVNLSSLAIITILEEDNNDFATVELGLRKEFREMLPIVVYKESFSVRDTLCSVCLSDYQAEDRLQQIPACGHTFHIDCIDSWLSIHSTCPLCRLSLLSSHKFQVKSPDVPGESSNESSAFPHSPQVCEETEDTLFPGTRNGEPETVEIRLKADAEVGSHCADCEGELRGVGNAAGVYEHTGGSSG